MQKNPVIGNVNKILIGAILWGAFYLRLFFDESSWNQTFFGSTFPGLYQSEVIYGVQIVFFSILNLNLYHYTVGKRHAVLDISRFFRVFIFSALVVLAVQAATLFLDIPFHYGIIGYLFGDGVFASSMANQSYLVYGLYTLSSMLMVLYIAGILVYAYQITKMKLAFPMVYVIRFFIALGLYALVLGYSSQGFDLYHMGFMMVYVLSALLVYIKTKYSLKALILSILLLFIL